MSSYEKGADRDFPPKETEHSRQDAIHFGLLGGSSLQPRKRKDIHGVGVSSLIGLKAQVAKKQSESKSIKDGTVSLAELRQRQRYRGSLAALLNLPNPGVEKRRKKDEAAGRQEEGADRLKESQEALERKAAFYDRMQKGEALNMDEYDKYEVDFINKSDEFSKREDHGASTSDDILSPLIFGDVGNNNKAHTRPMIGMSISDKRRELILEIEKETKSARERAKLQREARLQAQARKRQKLKQAYIQKRAASFARNQTG